jgi:small subunit ribosomal protein S9
MTQTKKKRSGQYAVGRRKTASARVRFMEGEGTAGTISVNGMPAEKYFQPNYSQLVQQPAAAIAAPLNGSFVATVVGGGPRSQAEAVRHGIARILVDMNEDWKKVLRQKGYLTRDPRMKERKKPGLRRARRAPQWSKR